MVLTVEDWSDPGARRQRYSRAMVVLGIVLSVSLGFPYLLGTSLNDWWPSEKLTAGPIRYVQGVSPMILWRRLSQAEVNAGVQKNASDPKAMSGSKSFAVLTYQSQEESAGIIALPSTSPRELAGDQSLSSMMTMDQASNGQWPTMTGVQHEQHSPPNFVSWLGGLSIAGLTVAMISIVMHMMPPVNVNTSHRLPPRWEPNLEGSLPFRTWLQDLLLWTITSDMEPHRQAAAIISQLGGAARELARTMTPQEIFHGGVVNGNQLDPVSYLIHGLSQRFSPLDDEIRIRAAQDLLHFQRRGNEPVDVLITRFETIRTRARAEGGGANISTESAALILLRAVGVSAEQFQRLTQPFGLRLPTNEQEFAQMTHQLRRMGHIIEHHPASIATSLNRGTSQGGQPSHQSFVSYDGQSVSQSSWSYVGHPSDSGPSDMWDYSAVAGNDTDWAFYADPDAHHPSDTDSATESDDGADDDQNADLQGLNANEADELLFWQYSEAKKRWRRFTGKPVRALRRVLRRKGKGKGKHKGKESFFDIHTALQQSSYFRQKGKGGKSSGKGWGRQGNPKGRDGQTLRCSICNSTMHLRARCPQNRRGSVQPASNSQASQLPIPPGRPASVTGFVSAQSVTESDGQVGPATLHFATSVNETHDGTPPQTPRVDRQHEPEVHPMTPDPWMNWHDPWSFAASQEAERHMQAGEAEGYLGWNGQGGVPGIWPPPQQGGFPSTNVAVRHDINAQRPELGPSLLTSSEANAMTQLFQAVAQSASPFFEEQPTSSQQPAEWTMRVNSLLSQPLMPAAEQMHPSDIATPQLGVFAPSATPITSSVARAGDVTTMFSQVHQLRQLQSAEGNHHSSDMAVEPTPSPQVNPNQSTYDGSETTCSICQREFESNDQLIRLQCMHAFHQQCIDEWVARANVEPMCPNCRGPMTVIDTWTQEEVEEPNIGVDGTSHHVDAAGEPEGPSTPPPGRHPATPEHSPTSTTFHTPQERSDVGDISSVFPWWPVPEASSKSKQESTSYHASTHRTTRGQLGILVDPGSYGNLAGERWLSDVIREAKQAGYTSSVKEMTSQLEVGGVGVGTQRCHQEVTVPLALEATDGATVRASFTAPTIPNSSCPALLGLKSLVDHNAVLDLGNRKLILMPKGAQLEPPIGSEVYSLEQASSGHLLLPIAEYHKLAYAQSVRPGEKTKHLFADSSQEMPSPDIQDSAPIRGKPSAKVRGAQTGDLVNLPKPSSFAADRWIETATEVIRIHDRPRTNLFVPTEYQQCPVPLRAFSKERITEVRTEDGREYRLQDEWQCDAADMAMPIKWTGCTKFTKAVDANHGSQGAYSSSASSAVPHSPQEWDVVNP